MSMLSLWVLFILVGVATFLVRLSFVEFYGFLHNRIDRLSRLFAVLPPAILAALCVPSIVIDRADSSLAGAGQLTAALACALVAHYCQGVFWPILAGMAGLWVSRWIL